MLSWVRASHAELDLPLRELISRWLAEAWPFEHVAYATRCETLSTTPPAGRTGAVRRVAAIVVAVVACVLGACGGTEEGAQSSRHLDPRSDAVVAIDLDYDSDNWEQVKRLYARAVQEGGLDAGEFTPPTLDEALNLVTESAGLSFDDDVRPLLGGTLQIGVRTEPAPPLSPSARDVLEQLDQGATRDGQGGLAVLRLRRSADGYRGGREGADRAGRRAAPP